VSHLNQAKQGDLPMKKNMQGFTLIELMIVVAIIAILAAIALPAYQDYVARSQATEALTATGGLRADLGVEYAENNAIVPAAGTVAAAAALDGKYFAPGGATVTAATGAIDVVFDSGALSGQTMTITPTLNAGQISRWVCTGLTSANHIPSGCR
jgi:type IV pilus assembly protein PilA